MGPGIIIPVLLIAVVVPIALFWAKNTLKGGGEADDGDDPISGPSARLTSGALRELAAPPWRVVYEISDDKLDGIRHVLIGPPGVFAIQTSMEPLPDAPDAEPEPHAVARAAITRGGLDDALARCAMSSELLVQVHWGLSGANHDMAVDVLPGLIAVDGRRFSTWIESLGTDALSPAQVDLAWQTVVTAIGRPDPLA
jgi:hypothetical protein